MNLFQSLRATFSGNYFPVEFLCVAIDKKLPEVRVKIVSSTNINGIDVTDQHLLLGAGPVIVGVCHPATKDSSFETAQLNFTVGGKLIGIIQLKKISVTQNWPEELQLFEGISAQCFLASPIQQAVQRSGYWMRQKTGKAFLSWQVNKMIQLLYSVPRKISVISVVGNGLLNVFPGDLNGALNNSYYSMSLRTGGQALNQVTAFKKIVIGNVSPKFHKHVFALGKNHMREMKQEESFGLSKIRSHNFHIPVPEGITSYLELELTDVVPQGFYQLLLFKIIGQPGLAETASLGSVHTSYASWRLRNGLGFDYLT
jgi:hypothetical protein